MPSLLDLFDPGVSLAAFAASLFMSAAYYAWCHFSEHFNDPLIPYGHLLMDFLVFIFCFRLSLLFVLAWSEGVLRRFHHRRGDDDDDHGSPSGTGAGTGSGSSSGAHPGFASQRSNDQKRAPGDRARTRSNQHGAPHHRVSLAIFVALSVVLMRLLIKTLIFLQFVSSRGNEYFCEIDEDYLTDRFNLTGLNAEVPYYQYALDLVTDVFDLDADDDLREQIEKSARHLYGLVHARYIVTTRGLAKMLEKYKKGDFGKCPRVMCDGHPLLPVGQSDLPNMSTVKLYCAKCEDTYNPKSSRHASIDGAYFGTSFHSILFQVYPALIPEKSIRRYEPRIYGFRVHAAAALARWQDVERDQMRQRLADFDIEAKFIEDSESDDEAFDYEEVSPSGAKNEKVLGDTASGRMDLGN
ncbi:hypothetical protein N7510_004330 [Penicillium lagena]|uniref:uncharacterized protein n=1 Tax=Penicillium lagena TaxID=94218 RepID=UPI0025422A14|nr:uncharacterized protein N7510_004330 [Penicillium lagena]KAJ5620346.1 hypothetical protein N7510_004330 [Penicillium lagena]